MEHRQPRPLRSKHETNISISNAVSDCAICGNYAPRCGCITHAAETSSNGFVAGGFNDRPQNVRKNDSKNKTK